MVGATLRYPGRPAGSTHDSLPSKQLCPAGPGFLPRPPPPPLSRSSAGVSGLFPTPKLFPRPPARRPVRTHRSPPRSGTRARGRPVPRRIPVSAPGTPPGCGDWPARPARPGAAPERLGDLPIARLSKQGFPPCHNRASAAQAAAAAAAALPEVAAPPAAAGDGRAGPRSPGAGRSRAARVPASGAAPPDAGAFCLPRSGRSHRAPDASLSSRLCLRRRLPPAAPADRRPPGPKPRRLSPAMPPLHKVAAAAAGR